MYTVNDRYDYHHYRHFWERKKKTEKRVKDSLRGRIHSHKENNNNNNKTRNYKSRGRIK